MLARQDWSGLQKLLAFHAANGGISGNYRRVDYLECTGHNARIDTGVSGNDDTLRFNFDYMPLDASSYFGQFGNYIDENTKCWRLIQSTTSSPMVMIVTLGDRKAGSSIGFVPVSAETGTIVGVKINYDLSYGKCRTKCTDGKTLDLATESDSSPTNSTNIAIGSRNVSGNGGTVKGRFWRFKIWSNDSLIRDYVPCARKSDSKAGFYDLVNATFNPSIGSAEFVAGMDA